MEFEKLQEIIADVLNVDPNEVTTVSYTHLTLPTKLEV